MKKTVEELLQCPYWIIDILPSQVPKDSPGQYFAVGKVFLQGDRIEEIKQKHIDLILKLNCYRDISISDKAVINPLSRRDQGDRIEIDNSGFGRKCVCKWEGMI